MKEKAVKICLFLFMQVFGGEQDSADNQPEMKARIWHNFSEPGVLGRDEIAGWSLAIPELLHFAADRLILGSEPEKQRTGERVLRFFGAVAPLAVIESAIAGVSHEYGHFRAYSMAGMDDYEFVNENDDSDRFSANPVNAFSTQLLTHWFGRDLYLAGWEGESTLEYRQYRFEFGAMMEAGGLNQQQYNAELVAAKVLDGGAHPLDVVTYFAGALGTVRYPLGENSDINGYIADLESLGVETNSRDIKILSQIPKLFSNSSISLLLSVWDFWMTGDKKVEPLRLQIGDLNFYWPEFASYLTLYGPTVKGCERIDWNSQSFTLSFEQSLSESMAEAGIGWKGKITSFLSGEVRAAYNLESGGWWAEGGPTIRLFSWLSVGVKAYYGDGYTFVRDISGNIPSFLDEREFGIKGFLELNFKF